MQLFTVPFILTMYSLKDPVMMNLSREKYTYAPIPQTQFFDFEYESGNGLINCSLRKRQLISIKKY